MKLNEVIPRKYQIGNLQPVPNCVFEIIVTSAAVVDEDHHR